MQPRSSLSPIASVPNTNRRLQFWYGALIAILVLFVVRLFYLQIVKHDHYRTQALNSQLREYEIPAERGIIKAHEGNQISPLVLNEKLYTLYVDPLRIKDAHGSAQKLADITKGVAGDYEKAMKTPDSRYIVLAKRLSEQQQKQITALQLSGIGTLPVEYRTYPQGGLASQILGFVNEDGEGKYGVEQSMEQIMHGTPGKLKAITDVSGAPLAASKDNVQIDPQPGTDTVLTIDMGMQKKLEELLKAGLDRVKSTSGSALIMDPNSGAVKAMANWPSYNPSEYFKVTDANLFNNAAVSAPLEVGSIMKVLTASAALDQGLVRPDTKYNDPGKWELNESFITNVEETGVPATKSVTDILNLSINTGATWLLMQMGGGEVNQQARDRWHDYMINHFQLGKSTGIEQGYEAGGFIPDPKDGYALSLTYANTAFGQALTATPLQMAAALSSVVNGGIYYQPFLVEGTLDSEGKLNEKAPKVIKADVVKPEVSNDIRLMMEFVLADHHLKPPFSDNYSVGGKTGTAQIANPAGGYYGDRYNGTYYGFVGGDKPQYVIMVRVNEPKIGKYAGAAAAQPLFGDIAHMLIDNFGVIPRTGR